MVTDEHEVNNGEISSTEPGKQNACCTGQVASQALDAAIDVLEDIQQIVAAGRPKALRVKFGDKTVAEVPLAVTAAAAFAAGLAAILLTKLAVEVVTED